MIKRNSLHEIIDDYLCPDDVYEVYDDWSLLLKCNEKVRPAWFSERKVYEITRNQIDNIGKKYEKSARNGFLVGLTATALYLAGEPDNEVLTYISGIMATGSMGHILRSAFHSINLSLVKDKAIYHLKNTDRDEK